MTPTAHPPVGGPARAGLVVRLERAAWFGAPGDGVAALAGIEPAGPVPPEVRWLAGVCLGAVGRYRTAVRWLAPDGTPAGSPAASCLASHLRQLGRHADAEPLDQLALATARTGEERADALVGLVADAVGRHDLPTARDRLARAAAGIPAPTIGGTIVTESHSAWRSAVRMGWVTAEVALLAGEPEAAIAPARVALRQARDAMACRHAVKTQLVLGASLYTAGRLRPAARVLRAAAAGATRLGLIPLLIPVSTLRAEILQVRAPETAARERQRIRTAQSIMEVTAERPTCG